MLLLLWKSSLCIQVQSRHYESLVFGKEEGMEIGDEQQEVSIEHGDQSLGDTTI